MSTQPAMFAGRDFTGHEHLPWFGLVNMNGRLYDPAVGRFLSADPYVQVSSATQSLNRYSYVLNNPLKYTDPTGEKIRWPKFKGFHWVPIFGWLDYAMETINYNTQDLRQKMVDAGIPDFSIGATVGADGKVDAKASVNGQEVFNTGNVDKSNAAEKVNEAIEQARTTHAWYSRYNWPALGSSALTMDALYAGDYLSATGHFLTCAAEVFTLGFASEISVGTKVAGNAAKSSTSAARLSSNGAKLNQHLTQLEKYGSGGYKTLQNGRMRYYGKATLNRGNANSFRMVREWNPVTGGKRTWFETLNPNGGVIQVRPELGTGVKTHYLFDGSGGFLGTW